MKAKRILAAVAVVATLSSGAWAQWPPPYASPRPYAPTVITPNNHFDPSAGYTARGPGGTTTITPNNHFDPSAGWTVRGPNGAYQIVPNNHFDPSAGWTIR